MPLRPRVSIAPTSARRRQASETVVGETPRRRDSSRTVGSRAPTSSDPDEIIRPIVEAMRRAVRPFAASAPSDATDGSTSKAPTISVVVSVNILLPECTVTNGVLSRRPLSHYDAAPSGRNSAEPAATQRPTGDDMPRTVKAALLQTDWAGDKESMIDKHEAAARDAAAEGAEVICFQELFYGPYFCQVQDTKFYDYTEQIPDGPTTQRFQSVAKELGMVMVLPMYEIVQAGVYYNTAAVIDADGTYLGKFRKQHIPQVKGFWEKFYFRPGNGGYPIFDTAVGKVGVYICYDRHFPEGWRVLGLNGAEIVFNPSATHRGLSEYIWRVEQPAAAVANMYYVGAINRVGIEADIGDNDFYGQSYFVDPEGKFVGDVGDPYKPELIVRELDLDKIKQVRDRWAFYRDRRPDAYDEIVASE